MANLITIAGAQVREMLHGNDTHRADTKWGRVYFKPLYRADFEGWWEVTWIPKYQANEVILIRCTRANPSDDIATQLAVVVRHADRVLRRITRGIVRVSNGGRAS